MHSTLEECGLTRNPVVDALHGAGIHVREQEHRNRLNGQRIMLRSGLNQIGGT